MQTEWNRRSGAVDDTLRGNRVASKHALWPRNRLQRFYRGAERWVLTNGDWSLSFVRRVRQKEKDECEGEWCVCNIYFFGVKTRLPDEMDTHY